MAGNYGVTPDEVRLLVGISSTDISDANVNTFIIHAEAEAEQELHTKFIPTRQIEQFFPNDVQPNFVMLRKTPVTRVVSVTAGTDNIIDVNDTHLFPDSGRLRLTNDAAKTIFDDDEDNGNTIEYYYGKMEAGTLETSLSASSGTGSGTTISVGTTTGMSVNDYIKIEGIRKAIPEITQVTTVGTNSMVCDLSWDHESGSRVINMVAPQIAKEYVRIVAGMMAARYMIGSTYTFATSYQFPEHSVVKGVPYPHFEKVYNSLLKRRESIIKSFRPQSAVY